MKFILILFGSLLFLLAPGVMLGQSLTLTDSSLVYEKAKQKIFVKKMSFDTDFYGYDLMDDEYVFFAYKRQDAAEERAIMAVFDIESQKEKIVGEVPVARTTRFVYNSENGLVLFNGVDGIYTVRIKGFLSGLSGPKRILSGRGFYKVFWVDARTFGYKELDEKTRQVVTHHAQLP